MKWVWTEFMSRATCRHRNINLVSHPYTTRAVFLSDQSFLCTLSEAITYNPHTWHIYVCRVEVLCSHSEAQTFKSPSWHIPDPFINVTQYFIFVQPVILRPLFCLSFYYISHQNESYVKIWTFFPRFSFCSQHLVQVKNPTRPNLIWK